MTDVNPNITPDFFGKDKFVSFVGQVEDVNDPKMGGRVKVRCVGWHPDKKNGKDGVKTEDLPWAQVMMPTTHAQQARIGGKHGLLPGSMVWGFFMDGLDGNHPIIVASFNHTPKAVSKDVRTFPQG